MTDLKYRVRRDGSALLAERGRFARYGPYINHVGLIIFLAGVMLRLVPGFMWMRRFGSVKVRHELYQEWTAILLKIISLFWKPMTISHRTSNQTKVSMLWRKTIKQTSHCTNNPTELFLEIQTI